jgi:16S rRNA (cytosine1402-N4)-methyltransferase
VSGGFHRPVLLEEATGALAIRPDGLYVDGTYGRGGHAREILGRLGERGRLLVMDRDPEAIAAAQTEHGGDSRVTIIHDEYARLDQHLEKLDLIERVDGLLLDLGVSSPQLDDAARGFSFQAAGPLDMRMNPGRGQSAADWLMTAEEREISDVLWRLGEEKYARRIARRIVEQRAEEPLRDTRQLAELIRQSVPAGRERKHPATRSFQAIRIRINAELEQLQQLLDRLFRILRIGGRVAIISFHSLEDRLVKRFFRQESSAPAVPRGLPLRESEREMNQRLKLIGKAIKPAAGEIEDNPRARSAVLRVAERIA